MGAVNALDKRGFISFVIKILMAQIVFAGFFSPVKADDRPLSLQQPLQHSLQLSYDPVEHKESMQACYQAYSRKLKVPGVLTVAVAIGYSDTVDYGFDIVTDRFLRETLNWQLSQPCKYENQGFCKFGTRIEDSNKPQLYSRDVKMMSGESMTLNVYVMNSSYDLSNSDNKGKLKEFQSTKTKAARDFYFWALQNADFVFYEGHSRDGGGPDFSPPRQSSSGGVNYPWYREHQPGLKFLLNAVDSSEHKPIYLGLFSCASQVHFNKVLAKHLPDTATILSTKVVEAQYTKEGLMHSLESVLNFECMDQLKNRVRSSFFVVNKGNR